MEPNYQQLVKEVHPDAECRAAQRTAMKMIFTKDGAISNRCDTERDAWKDAYDHLKKVNHA